MAAKVRDVPSTDLHRAVAHMLHGLVVNRPVQRRLRANVLAERGERGAVADHLSLFGSVSPSSSITFLFGSRAARTSRQVPCPCAGSARRRLLPARRADPILRRRPSRARSITRSTPVGIAWSPGPGQWRRRRRRPDKRGRSILVALDDVVLDRGEGERASWLTGLATALFADSTTVVPPAIGAARTRTRLDEAAGRECREQRANDQ
ncbi:hypothetical protein BH11MYX1_BH11MYX1_15450 [soil metagenome]